MKPLSIHKIEDFLERFDYFRAGEFRSLCVISATSISAVFALQDKNRAFDWITLELEFNGVWDANIPDDKTLSLLDMEEGITLLKSSDTIGFCTGKYSTISSMKNSRFFIYCSAIKYQENNF